MARFRGTVRGGRGIGSRLGHATTGLDVVARSWNGSIEVRLFVTADDEDWCRVIFVPSEGHYRQLYNGPLAKYVNPRLENIEFIPLWDGK